MTLATSQGNQPALARLPQKLPTTQAGWTQFINALQAWQRGLQSIDWQTPTLLNGWVYYGTPYDPPGFYMDAAGRVHLRGLVKSGVVADSIFQLPAGYWPLYDEIFAAASDNAFGQIGVTAAGAVNVWNNIGSNTWVSLSGISFSTT